MGRGASKAGGGASFGGKMLGATRYDALSFFDSPPPPEGELVRWKNSLTEDELEGVQNYTGSGYTDMNRLLRKGQTPVLARTSTVEKRIADTESAIAKFELKEDIKTFRECSASMFGGLKTPEEINAKFKGGTLTDKGFCSTSTKTNWDWGGGIRLEITCKAGKGKGAYVGGDGVSKVKSESEFLLQRNTTFRVGGARWDNGQCVVQLSC